jgi:hypothetical protein
MTFLKRSENGGVLDPRIATKGSRSEKKLTKRELLEKEQMAILRKLKPHLSQAIVVASKIMNDPKAAEAPRLKACTIILDNYKQLVGEVYEGSEDDEGEEVQPNQPKTLFSLHMLPTPTEASTEDK